MDLILDIASIIAIIIEAMIFIIVFGGVIVFLCDDQMDFNGRIKSWKKTKNKTKNKNL